MLTESITGGAVANAAPPPSGTSGTIIETVSTNPARMAAAAPARVVRRRRILALSRRTRPGVLRTIREGRAADRPARLAEPPDDRPGPPQRPEGVGSAGHIPHHRRGVLALGDTSRTPGTVDRIRVRALVAAERSQQL